MAITGIVMMAYADGFHGDSFVGVALAVGSASTSALYKVRDAGAIARHPCLRVCINFKQTWLSLCQVLFKMFLGSANLGEVAHFLSTMGFFNLIFISCVPLILYFTKVEHWGSLSSLPWGYMCGLAGLWLGEAAHRRRTIWANLPNTDIYACVHFLICIFNLPSSVQHLGPCGCGAHIPHSHLHRDAAECARQCRLGLLYVASCMMLLK